MAGGFSQIGKDHSMSRKRKLLGLALLAALAAAAVVVVTASANNREGKWITPGVKAADIAGIEKFSHTMEFSLEGIVAPGIVCETAEWDTNTLLEEEPFLEIFPTLAKCKTTGGTAGQVTIKPNGCSLDLYVAKGTIATTEQTADIICHLGAPMEITHAGCTITINTQKNLTGITYKAINEFVPAITASFNVKLAVAADGLTCPKGITGAKWAGSLTFEAFDTKAMKLVPLEVK
jgi:hypothetical protein